MGPSIRRSIVLGIALLTCGWLSGTGLAGASSPGAAGRGSTALSSHATATGTPAGRPATGGGGGDGTYSVKLTANPTSGPPPLKVTFTATASGPAGFWSMSFGDGKSGSQSPSGGSLGGTISANGTTLTVTHTYSAPGPYTATVTAQDANDAFIQASASATVTVTGMWITASGTPDVGAEPLAVTFSCTVGGGTAPYSYSWKFGDGATGTGAGPGHTYTKPGNYTATVTATDSTGRQISASVPITVYPHVLNVRITAKPTSGVAPLAVAFDITAAGVVPNTQFKLTISGPTGLMGPVTDWSNDPDFADWQYSYTFAQPGTYTVYVVAIDGNGDAGSAGVSITVVPKMPPPPMP